MTEYIVPTPTIKLDTTPAQAEVLFLSFQQLVMDMDRRRLEKNARASATDGLRHRGSGRVAAGAGWINATGVLSRTE